MAEIISGKEIADQIRSEIVNEIARLKETNIIPGLGVILVGDDPASNTYVRMKQKMCEDLGIVSKDFRPEDDITQGELQALINKFNNDSEIHGILVQLPLPDHINEKDALSTVAYEKDVDGFHQHHNGHRTNTTGHWSDRFRLLSN